MSDDPIPLMIVHGKQRQAIKAMIRIFGDDTSTVLNALHEMSARIALATGVTPEHFAGGVKHHWDSLVKVFNEESQPQ